MYELVKPKPSDKELLVTYKIELTNHNFDKASIMKQVEKDVSDYYREYKLIIYNNEVVGYLYNNKNIINEIFIDSNYRNLGIGTHVIKENETSYLMKRIRDFM